ncbi:MAG TPA: nitrate reductase [Rhizobiales bacterium]|nr:NapD protein [bacterium BMS3Bbin10]HDO51947.1 nitrate reductase [Hyphomicrobiales bacterium]
MTIAGILIHAYPGHAETVRAMLVETQGVELHHETGDGRFIITVEDAGDTRCDDTVLALQRIPGVASASLAYHNFEPEDINTPAGPSALPAHLTGGA